MTGSPLRATGISAAAAVALAMLAGCSSDAAPSSTAAPAVASPASASTSSSASPTNLPEPLRDLVSEPSLPPEATEFSEEGAEAFMQYVIDAVNWAYATGDSSYLTEVCAETSGFCTNVAASAQQLVDDNVQRHGGAASFKLLGMELHSSSMIVSLEVSTSAYRDTTETGASATTYVESKTSTVKAVMSHDSVSWKLNEIGVE